MTLTPERFIVIWQTSKTKTEVMERLGCGPKVAESRARYYRRKGVPLKYFRKPGAHDWAKLKKLAQEVRP